MSEPDGRPRKDGTDANLAGRLDRLSRDLDAERQERATAAPRERSDGAGYGQAVKLASEFVAGILVGAGLGWGLDRVAGTSPWGLIGFLLLGFGAGVLNVVRASGRMTAEAQNSDGKGSGLR